VDRKAERRKARPVSAPPANFFSTLFEATKKKGIDYFATILVTATLAGSAGFLTTWAWFKTAVALTDVVGCVAEVKIWLKRERFVPQVFVTGLSGGLIMTELLVKEFYEDDVPHPPTYVLYDLPGDSSDDKYNGYGTKFVATSTGTQFFIPHAIQQERLDAKILIFNDWSNTGNTLNQTKEQLKKMGFTNVKTAIVSASKINLHHPPDHICFLVDAPWDKLPWRPRGKGF
jgi:hypoxanthine phosphoribosyltransferase